MIHGDTYAAGQLPCPILEITYADAAFSKIDNIVATTTTGAARRWREVEWLFGNQSNLRLGIASTSRKRPPPD